MCPNSGTRWRITFSVSCKMRRVRPHCENVFSSFLSLLLILFLFASCANDGPGSRQGKTEQEGSAQTTKGKGNPDDDFAAEVTRSGGPQASILNQSIRKAARFLWNRQNNDGSWKSTKYGFLKPGHSLTPFVLYTLLQVPEEILVPDSSAVEKSFRFISRHLSDGGGLGVTARPAVDYPVYATSSAIRCFLQNRPEDGRKIVMRMKSYLVRQQHGSKNGWSLDHEAAGGWDNGSESLPSPPEPGRVDVSNTRYALQALRACRQKGLNVPDVVFSYGRAFLTSCRAAPENLEESGRGFYFSPVFPADNKAGRREGAFRPYGSATADVLLAALASGMGRSHAIVKNSLRWLRTQFRVNRVPGFSGGDDNTWAKALKLYYLSAVSAAFVRLDVDFSDRNWKRSVFEAVRQLQKPGGQIVNRSSRNREDDPLVGTSLGLRALLHVWNSTKDEGN